MSFEGDLDSDKDLNGTGSVTIGLSYMSNVLQEYIDSGSRALLYTTSATIEITDYSDNNVIDPVTVNLSTDNFSGDNEVELTTISEILSGTDYTFTVSIYNSAYSTTEPIVSGSTSSVCIESGKNTSLSIICLPSSPTSISAGEGSWSDVLTVNEEKWYQVTFSAGTKYTISQSAENMGTFLYNPNGQYIATINNTESYTYECYSTLSGSFYIGITPSASGTSILDITKEATSGPEGTVDVPKILTVDTTQILRLDSTEDSYYSFGTTEAGDYYLDILTESYQSSCYWSVTLYSDSAFTTELVTFNYGYSPKFGWGLGSLYENTVYYMKINSLSLSAPKVIIASPTYVAAQEYNEGLKGTPVELSIGTPHSGKLGFHYFDKYSYYTFTTGSNSSYQLMLTGDSTLIPLDMYGDYYSDIDFTTRTGGLETLFLGIGKTYTFNLSSNKTYYLRLKNSNRFIYRSECQEFRILVE